MKLNVTFEGKKPIYSVEYKGAIRTLTLCVGTDGRPIYTDGRLTYIDNTGITWVEMRSKKTIEIIKTNPRRLANYICPLKEEGYAS